jgi:NAD(P)-dependent dehydrogenase (short-subunit alcohol dehydrogenase family)
MQYLVTGASRGIGLELVRQLRTRGDDVIATVRDEKSSGQLRELAGVRIEPCDVASEASIAGLAARLGDAALDVVINNAGVWGGERQSLSRFDAAEAMRTYQTNALGPLLVSIALLPHVRRGTAKKLLHITSGMGSIGDNTSGGSYAYRMAKAALNMASRSLAQDLAREGIASAVINPGWVQTDMGGGGAPTPVGDSVRGILARLDELGVATTGTFLNWQGGTYPW